MGQGGRRDRKWSEGNRAGEGGGARVSRRNWTNLEPQQNSVTFRNKGRASRGWQKFHDYIITADATWVKIFTCYDLHKLHKPPGKPASDIPFSSPPLVKYYYMGSKKFGGSRTFPKSLETVLET